MRSTGILFALGLAAAGMMVPGSTSALPVNGSAVRALSADLPVGIEQVQYRRRHFINDAAWQRYNNRRWSRMTVDVESDGTILLPGIRTDHRGRTVIYGAPRNRTTVGRRLGIRPATTTGRLASGVPRVKPKSTAAPQGRMGH